MVADAARVVGQVRRCLLGRAELLRELRPRIAQPFQDDHSAAPCPRQPGLARQPVYGHFTVYVQLHISIDLSRNIIIYV